MWLIEVQVPLEEGSSDMSLSCFCLKSNQPYVIGRERMCDVVVDFPKISRKHLEIQTQNDGLSVRNCGRINMTDNHGRILGPNKVITDGWHDVTQLNFNHKGFSWFIRLRKLPHVKVSQNIFDKLEPWIGLEVDPSLSLDHVRIDNVSKQVANLEEWLKMVNSKRLAAKGELYKNIIPKTVDTLQEVVSNSEAEVEDEGYIKDIPSMVDVKPYKTVLPKTQNFTSTNQVNQIQSQTSRPARRGGVKSQLELYLDESEDSDEPIEEESNQVIMDGGKKTNIILSQATKATNIHAKEEQESASAVLGMMKNVEQNLADLNLKRPLDEKIDLEPPAKKPDTKEKMISSGNNKSLADVFKKTKQMKMERLAQDEELVKCFDKNRLQTNVKVKKFSLSISSSENPKIYTNYRRSYESDPKWENRLNYSKFVKRTNGSDYNPIMDSTIKTVRLRSSNYKSNEMQVNLEQDDDIMPDLDILFDKFKNPTYPLPNRQINESQISNKINPKKRRREPATLFVESDYEDTQATSSHSSVTSECVKEKATFMDGSDKLKEADAFARMPPVTTFRKGQSVFDSAHSDDDTPVFRSRKK